MATNRIHPILRWVALALAVVFGLAVAGSLLFAGAGDVGDGAVPTFGSEPTPDTSPATTAPATTVPTSEQDRRDREVCQQRARDAVVTYQPEKQMVVNASETVQAIVTSGDAEPPDDLEGGEAAEDRDAVLACDLEAELTGTDFEIEPSGPQQASLVGDGIVRWEWTVKPERSGTDLPLLLTIRGFVEGVDAGGAAGVRGPDPIKVDISVESETKSATERLSDMWFGFWSSTVWTAIAGVLAVLAFFGVRGRLPGRTDDSPKNRPPPPPPAPWPPPSSG